MFSGDIKVEKYESWNGVTIQYGGVKATKSNVHFLSTFFGMFSAIPNILESFYSFPS